MSVQILKCIIWHIFFHRIFLPFYPLLRRQRWIDCVKGFFYLFISCWSQIPFKFSFLIFFFIISYFFILIPAINWKKILFLFCKISSISFDNCCITIRRKYFFEHENEIGNVCTQVFPFYWWKHKMIDMKCWPRGGQRTVKLEPSGGHLVVISYAAII